MNVPNARFSHALGKRPYYTLNSVGIASSVKDLFAVCKSGYFNIHIWVWFGYFHLINKGNQVLW